MDQVIFKCGSVFDYISWSIIHINKLELSPALNYVNCSWFACWKTINLFCQLLLICWMISFSWTVPLSKMLKFYNNTLIIRITFECWISFDESVQSSAEFKKHTENVLHRSTYTRVHSSYSSLVASTRTLNIQLEW